MTVLVVKALVGMVLVVVLLAHIPLVMQNLAVNQLVHLIHKHLANVQIALRVVVLVQ
jgi:hypothetical protein